MSDSRCSTARRCVSAAFIRRKTTRCSHTSRKKAMPEPPASTPTIKGRRGRSDFDTCATATVCPKASTRRCAVTTGAARLEPMTSSAVPSTTTSARMSASRCRRRWGSKCSTLKDQVSGFSTTYSASRWAWNTASRASSSCSSLNWRMLNMAGGPRHTSNTASTATTLSTRLARWVSCRSPSTALRSVPPASRAVMTSRCDGIAQGLQAAQCCI